MAIIVEDGTGIADANSYASEGTADNYFEDRANTDWTTSTSDKEAALIRASASLDAIYREQFPGVRAHGRDQGLEWPRAVSTSLTSNTLNLVVDTDGNEIGNDEIPIEIIQATCELGVRELVTPGASMPDVERAIRRVQAGSVSVEYASNAGQTTDFRMIDAILSSLIGGLSVTPSLFGEAIRG